MIHLTEIFRNACRTQDWTQEAAQKALDMIRSKIGGSTVDWERGDEEWGRVLVGDVVKALVCAKVAVAVIMGRDRPQDVIEYLKKNGVSIIEAKTLDDDQYAVDKVVLEEIFGSPLPENVNYDH